MPVMKSRISFSAVESQLIAKGAMNAHCFLRTYQEGRLRSRNLLPYNEKSVGKLHLDLLPVLESVYEKLGIASVSKRKISLDAFQLSFVAVCVRVAVMKIRDRCFQWSGPQPESIAEALLARIEIHRKRAKRRTITAGYGAEFQDKSRRLKELYRWLRHDVLYTREKVRSRWSHYRFRQEMISIFARYAEAAITEAGYQPLPHKIIRKFVRMVFQEIRRKRVYLTIRELGNNIAIAKNHLLGFIEARHELTPIS
jgi:hypothetical protein